MTSRASAIDLYRQGHARAAERECERRIAAAVDDADAWSLLAEIHLASGRSASAVALLERLTQLRPRDAAAHRRLAGALLAQDRAAAAADALCTAIRLEPDNARAHNNLGQALMRQGRVADALGSFAEALRLDEQYAIGHNNLGLAHMACGDLARAEQSFRRAIALDPALIVAEVNLASVLERCGNLEEALRCHERALAREPGFVEAWVGCGCLLTRLCRFERALQCFESALHLRPDDAAQLRNKALVLLALERAAEALTCADAALTLEQSAQAHNIRAGALRRLGRHSRALESLDRARALDPLYVDAWCNRGMILHEMGDVEAATASYRRAVELDPDNIQARTRLLARQIPSVPISEDELRDARGAFDAQILALESWLEGRAIEVPDALTLAQQQFFYLSYQETCNRALLQRYRGASAARLDQCGLYPIPREPNTPMRAERGARRLKVGFISAHVHDHSVFNAILRGWLEHLDHERFELALFSVGAKRDHMTDEAAARVEQAEIGPRPVMAWAKAIRDGDFDALIYPEVGMNETVLALAGMRLAPRQFAAWGHPETSGLPTIDRFLSAAAFEPPYAEAHYTEHLLRLPNLGVHCRPYGIAPAPFDLRQLGLCPDRPVLVCPGVPFKYRPQDDALLVEIARRLGSCTFVFFNYEVAQLSDRLRTRIGAAFRDAGLDPRQYLKWIAWQPRDAFFGLLRQCDVYLDTIGFSGFNTMMQAVECHLPCVTHEGRFMRGRLGAGILRRLRLPELVAVERNQYVDIAVKLAADASYRAAIREALRRAEPTAYGDMDAVGALANVLLGQTIT